MRKRFFYTISAMFACCALVAVENDAVIVNSAVSCFGLPAGQKITVAEALKRFEAEVSRGNASAKAHLGLFCLRGTGVRKDAARAYRLFREAAAKKDILGQFGVGYCLYSGQGVARNVKAAVAPLTAAADAGNSDAMLLLFNIYRNGWAGACDSAAAMSMLRRAVAAGNAAAVYRLGVSYYNGEMIGRNYNEAFRLFQAASGMGYSDADVAIAKCYLTGKGVDKDEDDAVEYIEKAVARNNASALVLKGDLALKNGAVKEALELYGRAEKVNPAVGSLALGKYYAGKDEKKADSFLQKAVNAGSVEAMSLVAGRCFAAKRNSAGAAMLARAAALGDTGSQLKIGKYYLKQQSPRERDKAFAFLKKAAESGSPEAWYFLSLCYRNGYGTAYNPSLAADAAKRSADAGDSFGQLLYGVYFRDGIGVGQDFDQAKRYFELSAAQGNRYAGSILAELKISRQEAAGEKVYDSGSIALLETAAGKGDVNAMYLLGKFYTEGKGVVRDYNTGRKYLEKAASAKHPDALNMLGIYYARGIAGARDLQKMFNCFNTAAKLGSADAFCRIGRCYFEGLGVARNYAQAVKNFTRASELGSAEAEFWLGMCKLRGLGTRVDKAGAFRSLRRAASGGWADACCYVGLCYLEGNGVGRDLRLALEFFKKGAELGSSDAMYQLGLLYNNGNEVVKRDRKAAYDYFLRSAELGNTYGMYFLAPFYEYGDVVKKDTVQAAALYRQAAMAGNRYAQFQIGRCYEHGIGVFQDYSEAKRWYEKAKANKFKIAEDALRNLENKQKTAREQIF